MMRGDRELCSLVYILRITVGCLEKIRGQVGEVPSVAKKKKKRRCCASPVCSPTHVKLHSINPVLSVTWTQFLCP